MREDGNISIENKRIRDGKEGGITGYGYPLGTNNLGKLKVIFGDAWWKRLFMRGEYNVFDTDYKNYSIVFSTNEKLWILHREKNPKKEEIQKLIDKANVTFGLKNEDWLWTAKPKE